MIGDFFAHVGRWALGLGRWALGVGRWALGVGRWAGRTFFGFSRSDFLGPVVSAYGAEVCNALDGIYFFIKYSL